MTYTDISPRRLRYDLYALFHAYYMLLYRKNKSKEDIKKHVKFCFPLFSSRLAFLSLFIILFHVFFLPLLHILPIWWMIMLKKLTFTADSVFHLSLDILDGMKFCPVKVSYLFIFPLSSII